MLFLPKFVKLEFESTQKTLNFPPYENLKYLHFYFATIPVMDRNKPNQFFTKSGNDQIKIYACIDLDAFFAQCESRRLGLDDSVPLVALQWTSCWGVNYAARKYGVKSGMNITEAKKLCPNLVVAHADTVRMRDNSLYQSPYERDINEKFKKHDKATEKVSLDLYRFESEKIFAILKKNVKLVETGSIDEAFLDVTPNVMEILQKGDFPRQWMGKIMGGPEYEPQTQEDIMLMIGSQVVHKIRVEVKETLNYTCSAGISINKMLAKLGSGMNKPYGQAIIPRNYSEEAMKNLDIQKVRNFGRRIAEAFEEAGYHKIGDIQALNIEQILKVVGDEHCAKWVYFRCRGYDDEPIEEKDISNKSILSNKSFYAVNSLEELEEIEKLIVSDLCLRVTRYYEESNLIPHTLSIHYYDHQMRTYRSKSSPINLRIKKENFLKVMQEKTHEMLKFVCANSGIFPCTGLGVAARGFEKSDMKSYGFDLVTYAKKKQEEKEAKGEAKNKENISFQYDETSKSMPVTSNIPETSNHSKSENEPKMGMDFEHVMEVETVICERCKIPIRKDEFEAHNDFHIAQDLDRQLNPNKRKYKREQKEDNKATQEISTLKQPQNAKQTQAMEISQTQTKKVKKTPKSEEVKHSQSQFMKLDSFFKKK